jgi:hypothetical protein
MDEHLCKLKIIIINKYIHRASSDEIVKIFTEHSNKIFDRPAFLGNMLNLVDRAKYDATGLESVLLKYFSVCKLSDVLPDTNVSVTTVRLEK